MRPIQIFILTFVVMTAFAGNSLLCRLALKQTAIDPASFTFIRIVSGAIALQVIVSMRKTSPGRAGSWTSALALFVYAAGFSFAYVTLPAGTGALLLFGAVQATMIIWALRTGERLRVVQRIGLALALGGLVALVFPGLSAPPLGGSVLMLSAGVAWGIYSLRGKTAGDPASATAGNFLRAAPIAAVLSAALLPWARLDRTGIGYAIVSGAIASGVGYAIWYTVCLRSVPPLPPPFNLVCPSSPQLAAFYFLASRLRCVLYWHLSQCSAVSPSSPSCVGPL